MKQSLMEAIREAVPVPAHIRAAAAACSYDLLFGPLHARKPASGDWADFSEDDYAPVADDLGPQTTQVYTGPVGEMLREFISELPSTLYADEDQEFVSADEPEGEEIDGEWTEPSPYLAVEGRQIVEALFGPTISKEFH